MVYTYIASEYSYRCAASRRELLKTRRLRNFIALFSLFALSCTAVALYYIGSTGLTPLAASSAIQAHSCVNSKLQLMSRELFDYMAYYLKEKPYPGILNYTNYIIARHNAKLLPDVQPIESDMFPVYNDVRAFNYSIPLPNCQLTKGISLFVAVISAPANFAKRKAIREAWLKDLPSKLNAITSGRRIEMAGFAFVMGHAGINSVESKILAEHATFGDIFQIDMMDAYYNLTLKMTGLLNWLDLHCNGVDFLFKVDDDVYVNVRNLGSFVRQIESNEPNVYCASNDGMIQRNNSKWRISYQDFPWQSYPYYCEGAGVMIAGAVVRKLLAAAQTIPYLKFDDIYYTGLVTAKAGITLMMGDSIIPDLIGDEPDPCLIRNSVSLLLEKSSSQMVACQLAVEKFYSNETQCTLYGASSPVNPGDEVGIPLTRVNASEQNLVFQMAEISRLSQ